MTAWPQAPRPLGLSVPAATTSATATAATAAATTATATPGCCTAMASLRVLAFDHEGRPVQFDTWLDDLQLYLLSDSKDSVSLFDLASGAAPAPPATADSATRSQWLTRDAATHLAIRNHLPLAECAHFGQHRTSQALYAAVVARYSSPAIAALGRLLLPYLFPELSAFATVEDLVSHLRTSNARYRATVPAEFLDRNQPPMFITLYFIVTRLPDSLRSVRDHFLSLDPTSLTVDLLEQHLLAAETSAVGVGAARGTPRPPFFEGCSPSPLAPSYAFAAAADVPGAEDVGAASASAKRRSCKGKGSKGGGGGSGSGGGGSSGGGGGSGGGGSGGSGGGGGGVGGGDGGSSGSGGGGTGGGGTGARHGGPGGGQRQQQQRRSETQSPHAEGDCYRCVPPDPGIAAAALGASESGNLPGTMLAQALHTFMLDAGTSRCFFRDSTTLTPLPAPVPVRLADPSEGPVIARSSTVLPCPAILHTLATEPPQVAASTQVSASGQVAASCSCRLLSHQTLLWHHRLGHPSLPRLHGMHSRLLVSGLPSKGEFVDVLIPWIRTVRLQLRERFGQDLPVLRLHFDRGGEFSSNLLRDLCRGEGILQSSTCGPVSPYRRPRPHCVGRGRLAMHRCSVSGDLVPLFVIRPRTSSSPDVTFDESVPFYRLFPYRSAPSPPPPLFLAPDPPPVDPLPPQGPAPSGMSQVDPLPGTAPVEVAVGSGAAPGAASGGDASEGAASGGGELGGAGSGGAGSRGAEPGGEEPGDPAGASLRLSLQQLREWLVRRARLRSGAPRAGGAGDAGAGGARVTVGAGGPGGTAVVGPGGARTQGTGAAGTGVVGGAGAGDPTEPGAAGAGGSCVGAAGAEAVDPGAGGAGGTVRMRPQPPLCLLSLLTLSSPAVLESVVSLRLVLSRLFAMLVALLVRVLLSIPGTHTMALRPYSVPLRVSLPAPPESSLSAVPHPESDLARAASPTVSRLLATTVTDPSFESAVAFALVAELLDFAATCRLDYATALVAESVSASPPSVGGDCALGTDVLEDRQEGFECLAAAVPRFASMLLAPEGDPDAPDIPTPRSYAEAITVDGMWIFKVKRPPGSPPAFKARYVARGSSQQQEVDYVQTFSPTPKRTTLWVLLHVAAQRDYELHSLDFITAFLQGSLHEEIWLRRPRGFTESFRAGTQWSLRRPVYGLRQAPREWHDTLRTTLVALGFAPATADPLLFLRTDNSLPSF
ncbi:unnamed protein product [Closterium sp. NIES-54]